MQLWVYQEADRHIVITLANLDPSEPVRLAPYLSAEVPAETFLNRVLIVEAAARCGNLFLVQYFVPEHVPANVLVGQDRRSLHTAAAGYPDIGNYLAMHDSSYSLELEF